MLDLYCQNNKNTLLIEYQKFLTKIDMVWDLK